MFGFDICEYIFYSKQISLGISFFLQNTIKDDVPDLDPPGHGEVRPVQVGWEEDEADPVFWVPVED